MRNVTDDFLTLTFFRKKVEFKRSDFLEFVAQQLIQTRVRKISDKGSAKIKPDEREIDRERERERDREREEKRTGRWRS